MQYTVKWHRSILNSRLNRPLCCDRNRTKCTLSTYRPQTFSDLIIPHQSVIAEFIEKGNKRDVIAWHMFNEMRNFTKKAMWNWPAHCKIAYNPLEIFLLEKTVRYDMKFDILIMIEEIKDQCCLVLTNFVFAMRFVASFLYVICCYCSWKKSLFSFFGWKERKIVMVHDWTIETVPKRCISLANSQAVEPM